MESISCEEIEEQLLGQFCLLLTSLTHLYRSTRQAYEPQRTVCESMYCTFALLFVLIADNSTALWGEMPPV